MQGPAPDDKPQTLFGDWNYLLRPVENVPIIQFSRTKAGQTVPLLGTLNVQTVWKYEAVNSVKYGPNNKIWLDWNFSFDPYLKSLWMYNIHCGVLYLSSWHWLAYLYPMHIQSMMSVSYRYLSLHTSLAHEAFSILLRGKLSTRLSPEKCGRTWGWA